MPNEKEADFCLFLSVSFFEKRKKNRRGCLFFRLDLLRLLENPKMINIFTKHKNLPNRPEKLWHMRNLAFPANAFEQKQQQKKSSLMTALRSKQPYFFPFLRCIFHHSTFIYFFRPQFCATQVDFPFLSDRSNPRRDESEILLYPKNSQPAAI